MVELVCQTQNKGSMYLHTPWDHEQQKSQQQEPPPPGTLLHPVRLDLVVANLAMALTLLLHFLYLVAKKHKQKQVPQQVVLLLLVVVVVVAVPVWVTVISESWASQRNLFLTGHTFFSLVAHSSLWLGRLLFQNF